MKTRKILLLAAVAALGCVYALVSVYSRPDSVKTLTLSEKPDSILIEVKGGATLILSKDGDRWVVGEKKYPADVFAVDSLLKAVETVKVLDAVSSGGDDERYGLADGGHLVVKAGKGDKELRRLSVGKTASTSQQSYVRLDRSSEVLLVSGDLNRTFGKKQDELRDKAVFKFDTEKLTAIGVSGKASYLLAKSGSPETWKVAVPQADSGLKPDAEKMNVWISSLSSINAEGFAPEAPLPTEKPLGELSFDLGSRKAILTVHAETGEGKYLCSSSESPYLFYLSEYAVERCFKPLDELMMK